MRSLEEAREYFKDDKFATLQDEAVIMEVTENTAKVMLTIRDFHKNARGFVMGGAIYTLADFAFAVATNNGQRDAVTVTSNISYLKPPKGEKLFATATPVKDGRGTLFYAVKVEDDLGNHIAQVSVTGAVVG